MPTIACALALIPFAGSLPPATDAEREAFLRTAAASGARPVGSGATGTMRVTLRDGRTTADAHVQSVDIRGSVARDILHLESAFTDSYRYNIAAYLVDRMLGLRMVPVVVEREFRGRPASYTWWIEGALTEAQRFLGRKKPPDRQAYEAQMRRVRFFDYLIDNTDRNKGNILIDRQWRIWMIDHSRAFRIRVNAPLPAGVDPCAGEFRAPVQSLDPAAVKTALEPWLQPAQIEALLRRRQAFLAACPSA